MRMQKRQFRIGELAKHLDIEKFVIRFWEKEFELTTTRSNGGQRFYSEDDLQTFKEIKSLLYEQGFTIAGAKKQLRDPDTKDRVRASEKTTMTLDKNIVTSLLSLKKQLMKIREAL